MWMKSSLLERETGNRNEERKLLDEALKKYDAFDKLWLMRGQLEYTTKSKTDAISIYLQGLQHCPHSVPLWLSTSRLEEEVNGNSKARAILEKSRLKNPKNPDLWLESIRVEIRAGNKKVAQNLLAKGLQECPSSGKLWAEAIEMEVKPQKKARSVDALKRCDTDPFVVLAVAKLFWDDRKIEKARTWFNRTVSLDPDLGDAWSFWYKFELQHGNEEQQELIVKKCSLAEPHHGDYWIKISKKDENSKLKYDQILKKVVLILP